MIPYGRQDISPDDIRSVLAVLESDWLTQGPSITEFEHMVSSACSSRFSVACSNATAALHIACKALGLGPGDTLWTSPNTFVATANAALYCGADVDFVDIDLETGNMDVVCLERKLQIAAQQGKLPRIVAPVHFAGLSCPMEPIQRLAQQYGFAILEDASHAIGATYRQQPVGSCAYSHITVFSFHPVKIITTGEGGMALTNDETLYRKMTLLRSHGVTRDHEMLENRNEGGWYYEQQDLGFNYRMTDLQAALGVSQMKRIDDFLQKRRLLVRRYREQLRFLPLDLPGEFADSESAWHLFVVRLRPEETGKDRRGVFEALRAKDIGVNVHYIPVPMQPYYRALGFRAEDYPAALTHYERALSLPLHPGITQEQQDYIITTLGGILRG
ncbi:UDP-4-keto-6-deoxy-N-acetylglucosamine 4-aminotransferase [Desulfurispirillum indicum S5]|uniref:UDP-4-keto-6-deoxy-N-acetylglucosamine 4-aminotransferase n=1 Tax=Desulfurispirillum indicum (strain ATCC BAA-1389 / DSM 22839 / S5) TaxID=653733 RepID=E6W539_DESIS|nr:UDP-4-amino-4,6-dideoxy-N-acetyl-beta-L-altrosamine transaminase [Desulfurispirillum indicum]ADU66015.1 UDP-4-keto-6-deoxy-N-acetylglucosamine 4-aminotransferase [Desulfurispirillum indicum S5]